MADQIHLGDGAYAKVTNESGEWELVLYTSDGFGEKNRVYLGASEVTELVRFAVASPAFAEAVKRGVL